MTALTDVYPPEEIADRVRKVLVEAVDAAIENWAEGFWEGTDWTFDTTEWEVLTNFQGFLESWLDVEPPDSNGVLNTPVFERPEEEDNA